VIFKGAGFVFFHLGVLAWQRETRTLRPNREECGNPFRAVPLGRWPPARFYCKLNVRLIACFGRSGGSAILSCEKCGAEIPEGTSFCAQCGTPLSVAQIGPVSVTPSLPTAEIPSPPEASALPQLIYAGFWLRAIAYLLDTILVSLVFGFIGSFYPAVFLKVPDAPITSLASLPQLTPTAFVLTIAGVWLYYTAFEASSWQATPGKRALRLRVTDMSGRPLTFGRAAARNAAKLISNLTFLIGYLIAGFTPRKQALHDMLASCLVLRRR